MDNRKAGKTGNWPPLVIGTKNQKCSGTEVPNLSLTMYPFSISTNGHVPLKFLMTKKAEQNITIN